MDRVEAFKGGYLSTLRHSLALAREIASADRQVSHQAFMTRVYQANQERSLATDPERIGKNFAMTDIVASCQNALENGYSTAWDYEVHQMLEDLKSQQGIEDDLENF